MEIDDVFHRELSMKLKNNNIHYLFMGFYTPWMGGEYQEGDPEKRSNGDILVGTRHTPTQFVNRAQRAKHLMDENALEKITKDAIKFVSQSPPELVSIERKKNLLKAKILAKQLEGQEKILHEKPPEVCNKSGSRKEDIALAKAAGTEWQWSSWKRESHWWGRATILHAFLWSWNWHPLRKPNSETQQRRADWPWESRRPQTDAPGFAEHLEETAQEEVEMSFLEGPFFSAAEVTEALGHPNWRIMRRFVIEQGAKLRPIDDGLEAQLNSAYTSTIRLDLQDADYVNCLDIRTWED